MDDSVISLPAGVRRATVHDAPALLVETAASRATIHLDGAHVTSWVPADGDDVLWVSPQARYGRGASIRGGIPLIGPWFGPGRDGRTSPAHGWLRSARWELEAAERIGEAVTLVLALQDADPSGAGITARAFVSVGEHLTVELTITAGSEPLELESALHTYLAVSDVREVQLDGLAGAAYLDNTEALAPRVEGHDPVVLTGPTDRIYAVDDEVEVRDPVAGRILREEPAGSTRTVVWNPWAEGAQQLADMPDDAWTGFVCVETAAAKEGFVPLEPGASHAVRVRLSVREG
ncbi:D-hexose-6-phosphate mutarotase [Brachybacterium huguangmaarense]|uniref:Putative glucose-6-phosphate 1-epimerase n=1 Tax=Brachybacterium huguangmaarense TaxID=1652028 RepID=A0ABY6G1G6_9MICO|nr:D-hexose-6-phosphate mutarotase [Brachybacterium huguangmaarense]UYG16486.1 D-hexose-6-phosphate mutarotase [Brachybacterium huguangmaarense]